MFVLVEECVLLVEVWRQEGQYMVRLEESSAGWVWEREEQVFGMK